jgi:3,5-epimerase/4-reductase
MVNVFSIGNGFVSNHLRYPIIKDRLELNTTQIENLIDKYKPDVLINCIGKTGTPNIDWCENNREITALTNTALPIMLADVCNKKDIRLVQVGSGCIFMGTSPNVFLTDLKQMVTTGQSMVDLGWKEDDIANPGSFYSKTKYACDLAIGEMKNVSILRIRMPISKQNVSRNFISKILKYDQVIDIPNSVTFMDDFVRCVDWVIENQKQGIFHVTNPGTLSARETVIEYMKYFDHKFKTISEEQLNKLTVAKRSNCILNSSKIIRAGFKFQPAKEALVEYMQQYIKGI